MLGFVIVLFIIAGVAGMIIGLVSAHVEHKNYKDTHTKEEYNRWVREQAEKDRKERAAYWNSPMTRADWFIWGLTDKD